jgi:hypothetical protein
MKFYLNKPIISENEKLSWEKGEKLPKITLNQYDITEGTLDDIEQHIIDFIKKSFTDIKEALEINEFTEASVIMPSLQMCSVDEIDVIDMNIEISNTEEDDIEWMIKGLANELTNELTNELEDEESDVNEDFEESENTIDNIIEESDVNEDFEESQNPTEDEISEMEMDIIRKSLLGDNETM